MGKKYKIKMKSIFISGASGALGLAVSEFFCLNGFRVTGTYSSEKPKQVFPNFTWVNWKTNDLGLTEDLVSYLISVPSFDAWFHLSGGFWGGTSFENAPSDKTRQMMEMNFQSAWELAPVIIPALTEKNHTPILFVGAEAGLAPNPGYGAYGVSKAALHYFSQTLAEELRGRNITVNTIIPSTLDTTGNRTSMPDVDFNKWIKTEEFISVLEFLMSEKSRSVTGSVIRLSK